MATSRWHHRSYAIPPPKPEICPAAAEFQTWTGEYLSLLADSPSPGQLIVAKADLSDKYLAYWSAAKADCKYRATTKGHRCIFHVYMSALLAIREIELRLPGRSLGLQPKPDAMPSEVFIGVIEGEEDAADEHA